MLFFFCILWVGLFWFCFMFCLVLDLMSLSFCGWEMMVDCGGLLRFMVVFCWIFIFFFKQLEIFCGVLKSKFYYYGFFILEWFLCVCCCIFMIFVGCLNLFLLFLICICMLILSGIFILLCWIFLFFLLFFFWLFWFICSSGGVVNVCFFGDGVVDLSMKWLMLF